ncbi:MAG: LysR substrate-binding domain-containing protein, partial [Pseudomonadota bacterium]
KLEETRLSFSRTVRMATFAVVKEAVLHGVGIGILLQDSLYPSANLVAIPIRDMAETYEDCLVLPAEKQNLRLVRRFVDLAVLDRQV